MSHGEDEKKDCCDIAWIVVGDSGVGKSALINLYISDHVATSSAAKSCTNSTTMKSCKNEYGDFYLIDTIGYGDSGGMTNEEITCDIFKCIHKNGIENVKIIWMMNGDIRASDCFQKQAHFIDSFQSKKIWNSVLIIVKEQTPAKAQKFAAGAIHAIKQLNGVTEEVANGIGVITYTCWDWLKEEEKLENADLKEQQRKARNILNEGDVANLVKLEMDTINACKVLFNDQKCKKCGKIGDPRVLDAHCHFSMEKYHPEFGNFKHLSLEIIKKHPQNGIKRHKLGFQNKPYHCGSIETQPERAERYHANNTTELFHHGTWANQTTGRILSGIATLFISEAVGNWGYYTCCSGYNGSKGCKERWTCCKQLPSSSGCRTRIIEPAYDYYTCCRQKRNQDGGCKYKTIWNCCNKEGEDASPCNKYYSCCDTYQSSDIGKFGCQEYLKCCGKLANAVNLAQNNGCVLKCCQQSKENMSIGCQTRCKQCHGKWNDPKVKGCGIGNDYKHEMVPLDNEK